MTQPFEAWIVELIEGGDLSLPGRVGGYLHDHLTRTRSPRGNVASEHERVVAYVEVHGPDTDLCRKVVERLRHPDIPPTMREDQVSG